ncbi:response regulator transcription factor [Dactylosporangium sp. McL0621]|uniref:response regulator transcription factor n=1 Tax=Dactylosporangium sp. McL0621 TaxID=3415678 RepID=UPI003CF11F3F
MTDRIVLADDSLLLRVGLERLLAAEGFEIAGSAGDADELLRCVAKERPDAVIVDIRMPPTFTDEGLRAALRLRREEPGLAILLLSQYIETRDVVTILEQGEAGVGYLLKDRITDIDRFLADVRRVLAGGTAIDPLVVERVMRRPRRRADEGIGALSEREREILALMAEGLSNVAVSERLFLAERTVEAHIRSIFLKLGLPALPDTNRRVLAVLSLLRA